MKSPKYLLALLLSLALLPLPASAKGEINVEHDNGDTDTYSDVEIFNAEGVLYFKNPDTNTMLLITKNDCTKEGELLVCNKARAGIETFGVIEELDIDQIVLFINPTASRQPVKSSTVSLGANTVLLELATKKGTFITGLGKIDSSSRPVEASK